MRRGAKQWIAFFSLIYINPLTAAWSSPVDLSSSGKEVSKPQIAVDAKGNATTVWCKSSGIDYTIQSSTMPFGGTWQSPVDVSQIRSADHCPQITVDANSNVTLVWWKFKKTKGIVQASTMPFGGIWEAPNTLSRPAQDAENLQIAVDSCGNATAVWTEFNGKKWIIRSSSKPFGGTWQEIPDTLTLGGNNPQIGIDAHGNVTAVWQKYETTHNSIQSSIKPLGGTWGTPDTLSLPGQDAGDPQIVIDSTGCVTAVWRAHEGNNRIIQSSSKPFGGTWQETPDSLSQPVQDAHYARIGIDAGGNITAVWNGFNGSNWAIQASTKPFGGPWSTPDNLSQTGQDAELPKIVVDVTGRATAVWRIYDGTNWLIQASTRPFGGAWSAPDNLSLSGQAEDAQVAIDAFGNITTVWCKKDGSGYTIQASTNVVCSSVTDLSPPSDEDSTPTLCTESSTTSPAADSTKNDIELVPEEPSPIALTITDLSPSPDEPSTLASPCTPPSTITTASDAPEKETTVIPMKTSPVALETQDRYQQTPSITFIGRGRLAKKKLFLKTKWTKGAPSTIVRYEIFARNRRIGKILAKKRAKASIRLHPHHVPHRLSKGYRLYIHNKYKIRAVDSFGTPSSFTHITVKR
jgi:hypothetical protein